MKKYLLFVFLFVFFGAHNVHAYDLTLKIEGSDYATNIPYGATTTLSWTSTDMSSCVASQTGMPATSLWSGSLGSSGSVSVPNLTNNVYFTLTCSNSDASITVSDTAQAYINFLVKPSLYDVSTKETGGKFIPGRPAYLSGSGLLPTDNTINIGTLTTSPSAILTAASADGKNATFTVPDLRPGTYSIWFTNWNGVSDFRSITISSTSTPTLIIPAQVPTPSYTYTPPQTPVISSQTSLTCTSLAYDLKYQSRDSSTSGGVSLLQTFLREHGDLNSESTGYFGGMTLAAVKKFQGDNGIITTGFVGPLTRAKITAVSCKYL